MRNADNIRLTPPPQERGRLVRVKPCPELAAGPPALRSLPIPVQWHDRAWRPRLVVRLGERQAHDWRVSVLDCGGKRSATPLSGRWLNFRMTHNAFTPLAGSKAVSPPPHSRTASVFRGPAGMRTLFNL